MPAPVPYSDIGKSVSDLLTKDIPSNFKAELKSTASNGVTFTSTAQEKNGLFPMEFKAKYADKSRGLTLTETYTTANVLTLQAEMQDSLATGVKVDLTAHTNCTDMKSGFKVGLEYKHEKAHVRSSLDVSKCAPVVAADAVVGHEGFLLGADVAYSVNNKAIARRNLAFAYANRDYAVVLSTASFCKSLTGSYYHRVSSDVEAGARATLDTKSGSVNMDVGAKVHLDSNTFFKVKMDQAGRVGLGYSQLLKPGVKLGLGANFDAQRLQEPVHKLGVSFNFEL